MDDPRGTLQNTRCVIPRVHPGAFNERFGDLLLTEWTRFQFLEKPVKGESRRVHPVRGSSSLLTALGWREVERE